jgi:transcriptional regulator with XRE-family HTH domain
MLTLASIPRQVLLWNGMSKSDTPYATLGSHLKYVREQSRQSLTEVSGAVEIEEQDLERIEAGLERPAEDILLLLISHFGVPDREAAQLWELGEYDGEMPEDIQPVGAGDSSQQQFVPKPTVMILAMDMRTMYSDGLEVAIDPAGVTLQFTQALNPSHAAPVARLGMSHAQAEQVLRTLQQALLSAKYSSATKQLPSPESKTE